MYLRVELLDHMVTLCLTFWETGKLFFQSGCTIYNPFSNVWGSQFLHILTKICCLSFLIVTILVGVQGYLTVLLIYLTIINKEHFFHVLIGHLYIFWRNNRDYVQPVDLCRMAVLTWLSLLIHEYVMSVHVFMSSLMSCNKQCSFAQVLELLLLIYYWDFTLCDAIVYRVVFLMSFLDCPLLLCRNTIF